MKPRYAPERKKLLPPSAPQPPDTTAISVRPNVELVVDADQEGLIPAPETSPVLREPLQPFFEACGGQQALWLSIERQGSRPTHQKYCYQQPFVLIGRCPENDLVLPSSRVAFRHFYLQLIDGRWFYANLAALSDPAEARGAAVTGWFDPGTQLTAGPYTITAVATEAPLAADSREVAVRQTPPDFELELINGRSNLRGRQVQAITEPVTLIGASRACQLWLKDDSVSKVHAALVLTSSGVWIVDLLGRDGVLVNSRPAYWKQLFEDDVLQIGRFRFRARFDGSTDRRQKAGKGWSRDSLVRESARESEREPDSRGNLSEDSVVAMFDRMSDMQSQFLEHSQIQMQVIARLVAHLDRKEQAAVQEDMDRIERLTRELDQVKSELARTSTADTAAGTPVAPALEATRPTAAETFPDRSPAIPAITGDGGTARGSEQSRSDKPPRAVSSAASSTSAAPIPSAAREPIRPLQLPTAEDRGDEPGSGASPEAANAAQFRLTERMANLARERNSVWRRVLKAFGPRAADSMDK